MIRKSLYLCLAAAVIFAVGASVAAAADGCPTCNVKRTTEKTDTGIRCTIIAQGDTTAEQVRKCVRANHADEGDNVTVSFEDVDGGIVVVQTGANADAVAALHAKADTCAKGKTCAKAAGGTGCCKHHHGAKAADQGQGCCKHHHGDKAAKGDCPMKKKTGDS